MSQGNSLKAAIRKIKHTPSMPMSHKQWQLLESYSEKLGVSKSGVNTLAKETGQPTDSFFKKWESMLDFFD